MQKCLRLWNIIEMIIIKKTFSLHKNIVSYNKIWVQYIQFSPHLDSLSSCIRYLCHRWNKIVANEKRVLRLQNTLASWNNRTIQAQSGIRRSALGRSRQYYFRSVQDRHHALSGPILSIQWFLHYWFCLHFTIVPACWCSDLTIFFFLLCH